MLRVYLIIYIYILEWLPEHFIFRVNLGSVINIFTVLGWIFISRLSFERGFSFVILQFCSVPRDKCFLLHSLSSRCVRFFTVQAIEQVILNLDYHGILVNIIFRS